MAQLRLQLEAGHWEQIRDGDLDLRAIYDRHYSRRVYRDGRQPKKTAGPGEYIALLLPDADGAFIWRKFIDDSGQKGINCAVFRNESAILSSELILEAETYATARWPGERFYTYVNGEKIQSTNPGYCFIKAGWRPWGYSKNGKRILEKCANE